VLDGSDPDLEAIVSALNRDLPYIAVRRGASNVEFRWAPPRHEEDRLRRHPRWDPYDADVAGAQLRIRYVFDERWRPSDSGGNDMRNLSLVLSGWTVQQALNRYMLVADLAYPGMLQLRGCLAFVDGEPYGGPLRMLGESLELVGLSLDDTQLKVFEQFPLTPANVRDWLWRLPGFDEGVGRGAVGRAVSACTRLQLPASRDSNVEQLVWITIGLESLRDTQNEGAAQGVRQLLRPIYGSQPDVEDMLGEMYRLRSELLHGQLDLPLPWFHTPLDDVAQRRVRQVTDMRHHRLPRAIRIGLVTLLLKVRHRIAVDLGLYA
jgi:hypothetical protein